MLQRPGAGGCQCLKSKREIPALAVSDAVAGRTYFRLKRVPLCVCTGVFSFPDKKFHLEKSPPKLGKLLSWNYYIGNNGWDLPGALLYPGRRSRPSGLYGWDAGNGAGTVSFSQTVRGRETPPDHLREEPQLCGRAVKELALPQHLKNVGAYAFIIALN